MGTPVPQQAVARLPGLPAVLLAVLMTVLGGAPGSAHAELRALLVGVSSYPTLPADRQLTGPRQDVLRMQRVLQQRGFQPAQTLVLADGVPGADLPTRANILSALERLATLAAAGDTVYLHFSGHGSRQPAPAGAAQPGQPDANGTAEAIFLPRDTGRWDGEQRAVSQAIRAGELRAAVDRITARGAFVWAVFDACHAARLVRGSSPEVPHGRYIEPGSLGVPAAELERADGGELTRGGAVAPSLPALVGAAPTAAAAAVPGRGGTALFYAAQAGEAASEVLLPVGQPGASRQGLFSHVIANALLQGQAITYRQLAQYILAEYRGMIDARATPLFAGNGLDTQVLGRNSLLQPQWPLQTEAGRVWVPAGSLAGLGSGAILAVLPDALAPSSAAVGHLGVKASLADRSELVPLAHAGKPAPPTASLRTGQTVRLVSSPLNFDLHIAVDRRGCAARCLLDELVARLQRDGVPGVAAVWQTDATAGADIVLAQDGGRLVLMPPSAQGSDRRLQAELPGLGLAEAGRPKDMVTLSQQLADRLHAMARSRNLLRIAGSVLASPQPPGLVAELQAVPAQAGKAAPVAPGTTPVVRTGDRLVLTLGNRGLLPLDVTALYLDAAHGVLAVFPDQAGSSNRLDPGMRRQVEIEVVAPPVGAEHLLVIAVEARRLAEPRDYSFLQQASLGKRSGADASALDAFADAAFAAHRTRGAATPAPLPAATAMQLFSLTVQP